MGNTGHVIATIVEIGLIIGGILIVCLGIMSVISKDMFGFLAIIGGVALAWDMTNRAGERWRNRAKARVLEA